MEEESEARAWGGEEVRDHAVIRVWSWMDMGWVQGGGAGLGLKAECGSGGRRESR